MSENSGYAGGPSGIVGRPEEDGLPSIVSVFEGESGNSGLPWRPWIIDPSEPDMVISCFEAKDESALANPGFNDCDVNSPSKR